MVLIPDLIVWMTRFEATQQDSTDLHSEIPVTCDLQERFKNQSLIEVKSLAEASQVLLADLEPSFFSHEYLPQTNAKMWSWFGGSSTAKKKELPKNAILTLRQQLEMLQKRETHLERQMSEQDAIARKHISTNKNAARAALTRKKQHEHSFNQTQSQISQLEQQIYSIESANINYETLKAMENAGKAMKAIHGGMTMEKVDSTLEELREQHALGEEIGNAITSTPLGEPIDPEELDQELEDLVQEDLDNKMLETGQVPVTGDIGKIPTVPNGPVKGKAVAAREEDDEEAELKRLQAEMAI
ncbi:MAG: ESCRT-III subunit protein snf7 [Trichoglossum hirsutum]|nr:MAG: ESCRT-III subunit protein snf7 [Trichoglossum hirsutum]